MLSGESLKKIAEKTMIPKRNLIRWKHEYLHQDRQSQRQDEEEESVGFGLEEMSVKRESVESKENLSAESTDLIRLQ
jgi:hypothetical protein